ncbi:MBG domain-containing protein [Rufibacter latericius]|uniref:T9SS C-terminal target domain-containing protein n=1 Tax=Rufibacter latericius TaxID=2487040 RepID=A0A3M9MWH5_9BACT|nr:MBG domain-containing protein [Rufibacter latericius]RNI29118.1 T9SS C-terminal target domain-containing protein [Rufibacter latericius]
MNVHLLAIAKANARRYGIMLCFLILGTVGAFALGDAYVDAGLPAPTVTSDKDDYSPGQVAHIKGSGWTLDQSVHIEFREEPDYPDVHSYDVPVNQDGTWKLDYNIEDRHLGVKFTVTTIGKTTGTTATTVFTDAGISNVTVTTGNTYCTENPISVRFEKISAQNNNVTGQFVAGATFIAELINSSGTSNLGEIGRITDNVGNNGLLTINGKVPPITTGSTYRVRVRSINPITNTPTSSINLQINESPTTANAGADQLNINGTSTNLSGNQPSIGTGTWSIVTGTGGYFGTSTTKTTTSTTSNATFNGTAGESYTLKWTNTNGSCTSSDNVIISFRANNPKPVLTTVAPVSKTVGEAAFTLTVSGSNFINGSIIHVNGIAKGTEFVNSTQLTTSIPASDLTTAGVKKVTVVTSSPGGGISNELDFTVNQAQPSITWIDAGIISYGTNLLGKLNAVANFNGAPVEGTFVYKQGANVVTNTTILNASTSAYPLSVEFTPTITTNYKTASGTNSILVKKAANTITFTSLGTKTFGDAAFDLTASASSSLPVTYASSNTEVATISGSTVTIKRAGKTTITATQSGDNNYEVATAIPQELIVNKATITPVWAVGTLSQTYDNTVKTVVAFTTPAGLTLSYDFGSANPKDAGSYPVTATINDANYQGSVSGSLVIAKAPTATLVSATDAIYNGSAHSASAMVTGAGELEEPVTVYYSGVAPTVYPSSTTAPTNAGTYKATATYAQSANYLSSTDSKDFTIEKATITPIWAAGTLSQIFDNKVKTVVATTTPSSLTLSYDFGSATPKDAGSYPVTATIIDDNYSGSLKGTLEIAKANQTITFAEIGDKTFGDAAFDISPSATSNLPVKISTTGNISHDESTGKITINGAGPVSVTATQDGNANYNAAISVTRSFKVNKANQTITVVTSAPEKAVYNSTFTVAATASSGLPVSYGSSDKLSNVGAQFTMNSGTGTGTVSYSQDGDDNYNAASIITEIVTAEKANQTITVATVSPASAVYNTSFTVEATATSGLAVVYSSSAPLSNIGDTYTMNSGTGTGIVRYNQAGDDNYHAAPEVTAKVTAQKAAATITLNTADLSQTYNGSAKTVSYSISPADVTGVSVTYSQKETTVSNPTNAGAYEVLASLTNDNYSGSAEGTLVIAKASTKTEVVASDAIYNGSAHKGPATVKGDGGLNQAITVYYAGVAPTVYPSSTNAPVNAGTYSATASYAESANYLGSSDEKEFTIDKASSITEVTVPAGPFTYTGKAQTPATVKVTGAGNLELTPTATYGNNINAGTATASYTFAGDDNHTGSEDSKSFIIEKASSETIVNINGGPFTYTGSSITPATVEVTGAGGLSLTPTAEYSNNINAGTATASFSFSGDENHTGSEGSKTFIIGKKAASVVVAPKTKVYGAEDPDFTGTLAGFIEADKVVATYSRVAGETVAAGPYPISATLSPVSALGNYDITNTPATLTISARPITVKADDKQKTYGDVDPELTYVITSGSLVNKDAFAGVLSRAEGEKVGSYTIDKGTLALGDNYDLTFQGAKLTINKKVASVVVDTKTKVYGDNDPSLTGTVTGFLAADKVVATYSRATGENVSTYAITAALAPQNVLDNYEITNTSATLNITKKAASVTPIANSKTYGSSDPTLTGNLAGFLTSDNVTATYSRAKGETVTGGPYQISATLAPVGVLGNYDITYNTASFTIGKKEASVVVAAKTKEYGAADPEFTGTLTGFLASDNVQAAYRRVAGETVSDGPYAISATLSPATVLSNYEISNTPATLTITKKALVVTAQNTSKYCGQVNPLFTVTYDGFVNNESSSVLGGTLSYSTTANVSSGQATYDVTPGGFTSSNYAITFRKGTLTVNGVTIDASASGSPVPVGSKATLSATVLPNVPGVNVIFNLDGKKVGEALTGSNGVANFDVLGLITNVYQVEASTASGCAKYTAYLPVYDPNGGFVTGGGWINSPAGAYVKDPAAVGKANFGFVSRYKKGSTTLDGETEFQFQAGNLKFNSTSYEAATLVISGAKASYRGVGTINGTGTYKFTLNAIDGQVSGGGGSDKIRMKITDAAGGTVYDNLIGTADNADLSTVTSTTLGGGSIVIHEVKAANVKQSVAIIETPITTEAKLTSYPNPLTDEASVEFSVAQDEAYSLDIYDMKGGLVKNLQKGKAVANETITAKWDARSTNVGVYIIRLTTNDKVKTIRVVRQ